MTNEDVRVMLLLQRRLFGSQKALAQALHVSEQSLSQFLCRQNPMPRADCEITKALGLEVEVKVERTLKPMHEL